MNRCKGIDLPTVSIKYKFLYLVIFTLVACKCHSCSRELFCSTLACKNTQWSSVINHFPLCASHRAINRVAEHLANVNSWIYVLAIFCWMADKLDKCAPHHSVCSEDQPPDDLFGASVSILQSWNNLQVATSFRIIFLQYLSWPAPQAFRTHAYQHLSLSPSFSLQKHVSIHFKLRRLCHTVCVTIELNCSTASFTYKIVKNLLFLYRLYTAAKSAAYHNIIDLISKFTIRWQPGNFELRRTRWILGDVKIYRAWDWGWIGTNRCIPSSHSKQLFL